jgi:hypothetical protein
MHVPGSTIHDRPKIKTTQQFTNTYGLSNSRQIHTIEILYNSKKEYNAV